MLKKIEALLCEIDNFVPTKSSDVENLKFKFLDDGGNCVFF